MKAQKIAGPSVRELKAAALDALVKQEIATKHASQASKMIRLKALRLARDAGQHIDMRQKPRVRSTPAPVNAGARGA
jgi:hypothetical protein